MKKIILLPVLAFLIPMSISSQSCLPQGIDFTKQSEIDNFQSNYPNCTIIEGDVRIEWSNITNLNGLSVLTSFGGNLEINSTLITSLAGLDNITSINKELYIHNNASLTSLDVLSNLSDLGGSLRINDNPSLTSLAGLENLSMIGGELSISKSNFLNLSGLDSISLIGDRIILSNNPKLTSLSGLNNLKKIGAALVVYGNDSLSNIIALSKLESMLGYISIEHNESLSSLYGLENIDVLSIENIYIRYNPVLKHCEAKSICDFIASPNGTVNIFNNSDGCNSPAQVQDACDAIGIENINSECIVSIYPNPVKDNVFISCKNSLLISEINIYDRIGKRLLHETKTLSSVDVSKLSKGMYLIELVSSGYIIHEKIIKE